MSHHNPIKSLQIPVKPHHNPMKSLYIINPPESPGFPLFHTFSIYFVVAVSLSEQIFTGAGRRSLQVDGGAAERHAE